VFDMGRKKRAWNMSNPLYRYLHGGKKASVSRKSRRSGTMARRKHFGRKSSGGGFGGRSLVNGIFVGMGAAAMAKRFVGAPLGAFTGAGAGAASAFLLKENLIGSIAGGALHDFVGNVGGQTGTSGGINLG
jgi:hypothetical protein